MTSFTERNTMPAMEMIAANQVCRFDQIVIGDMVLRVNSIIRHSHTPSKIYFECKHAPTFVDYYISFDMNDDVEIYGFFKQGVK